MTRYPGLVVVLIVLWTWTALPGAAHASPAGKQRPVAPSKKDLCANAFGGSIPYDHKRYHWFCSGLNTVAAHKSASLSLQCGPKKFDKRKKYGYWVSSPALKLTQIEWDPSYAELNLTFHNGSSKKQTYEYWESCVGPS